MASASASLKDRVTGLQVTGVKETVKTSKKLETIFDSLDLSKTSSSIDSGVRILYRNVYPKIQTHVIKEELKIKVRRKGGEEEVVATEQLATIINKAMALQKKEKKLHETNYYSLLVELKELVTSFEAGVLQEINARAGKSDDTVLVQLNKITDDLKHAREGLENDVVKFLPKELAQVGQLSYDRYLQLVDLAKSTIEEIKKGAGIVEHQLMNVLGPIITALEKSLTITESLEIRPAVHEAFVWVSKIDRLREELGKLTSEIIKLGSKKEAVHRVHSLLKYEDVKELSLDEKKKLHQKIEKDFGLLEQKKKELFEKIDGDTTEFGRVVKLILDEMGVKTSLNESFAEAKKKIDKHKEVLFPGVAQHLKSEA